MPLRMVIEQESHSEEVIIRDISPLGLSFEIKKKIIGTKKIDLYLYLPVQEDPIFLEAKIVWQRKKSLEDNSPYNIGVEIVKIRDKNKNVFVKYMCDLLYDSVYDIF